MPDSTQPPRPRLDAIALLVAHHERMKALLANLLELCRQNDASGKPSALVNSICEDLALHSALAQELFLPAARLALDDAMLVDAALAGLGEATALASKLHGDSLGADGYLPKVTSLDETLGRQFAMEEGLFTAMRGSKLDIAGLGLSMCDRKLMLENAFRFDGSHWVELPGS